MRINIEIAMKKLKLSKYRELADECEVSSASLSSMKKAHGSLTEKASMVLYAKYPDIFKLPKAKRVIICTYYPKKAQP